MTNTEIPNRSGDVRRELRDFYGGIGWFTSLRVAAGQAGEFMRRPFEKSTAVAIGAGAVPDVVTQQTAASRENSPGRDSKIDPSTIVDLSGWY